MPGWDSVYRKKKLDEQRFRPTSELPLSCLFGIPCVFPIGAWCQAAAILLPALRFAAVHRLPAQPGDSGVKPSWGRGICPNVHVEEVRLALQRLDLELVIAPWTATL